jgi:MFS family permease
MAMRKIFTRDYILGFFAQFSLSGTFNLLLPTLPIYLEKLGSKEVEIGVLVGAMSVSSLVLRPVVGKALTKFPERTFMLAGSLLVGLTSFFYLIARPFWPLLFVRMFQGVGAAFFYTASVTLIANISPEAQRARSLAYFYLAFNFAFALGPSFGMFLINAYSFTLLFLFCIVLSLCALFLTTRLERRAIDPVPAVPVRSDSLISFETLPAAMVSFFAHIIWGALTAFLPLYALRCGITNPGFFFGVYAFILILGRGLGSKLLDRYDRDKVILPCLAVTILSMIILAFSKTFSMFVLVAIVWGAGNTFLFPSLVACVLDRAGHSRALAMGTFTAISDLGVGLGPVIMGLIVKWTSYPIMFLCLALVAVINLAYFKYFLKGKTGGADVKACDP